MNWSFYKNYIIIPLTNAFNQSVYWAYLIYKKYLRPKFNHYDLYTVDFIQTLPNDAVCVDVGTNEGKIFKFLKNRCNKGIIYGCEPIPDLYQYLKNKYSDSRSKIFNVALSDKDGSTSFYYIPSRSYISSLTQRSFKDNQHKQVVLTVETKKLDSIFTETRLDFIKIDVEGAEMNVLLGAVNTIQQFKPVIIFETGKDGLEHFGFTPTQLFHFFEQLNYRIAKIDHYLQHKSPMTLIEFALNFEKEYDNMFIAYFDSV